MKCCKTCVHSRWLLTPTGRITRDSAGKCALPFEPPDLPDSICMVEFRKTWVLVTDGYSCPFYDRATGKPRAIDGSEPGYSSYT